MSNSSEQRSILTRGRIAEGTIILFNQRGIQVTVDEIAARADVSKGTVFNYFSSKEQLLYDVFWMCQNHAVEITEKDVAWEKDLETVVRQILHNSAHWASEYPEEVRYTYNYNIMCKNLLFDVGFAHKVKSLIDDERIAVRLQKLIPKSIPWDYFKMSIANQNYQLGLYLADHPEYRDNHVFIDAVIDWIWKSMDSVWTR